MNFISRSCLNAFSSQFYLIAIKHQWNSALENVKNKTEIKDKAAFTGKLNPLLTFVLIHLHTLLPYS